jgi:hypothetical protein
MSSYTMMLRKQIDYLLMPTYDLKKLTHDQKIDNVLPIIFNFDFPIFDESYRQLLERKFIKYFYFQELGFETYGEWHFRVEEFLQRRMPYYNRLYVSALKNDYDPFDDVGYKDTYTRSNDSNRDTNQTGAHSDHSETDSENHQTGSGTADGTSHNNGAKDTKDTGTDNSRTIDQDTPQSTLAANEHYASDIKVTNNNHDNDSSETHSDDNTSHEDTTSKGDATGKVTSDSKGDTGLTENQKFQNTEQYLFERHGRTGRFNIGQLIASQRKNIIDVDTALFDEARDLFGLLYDY